MLRLDLNTEMQASDAHTMVDPCLNLTLVLFRQMALKSIAIHDDRIRPCFIFFSLGPLSINHYFSIDIEPTLIQAACEQHGSCLVLMHSVAVTFLSSKKENLFGLYCSSQKSANCKQKQSRTNF